MLIHPTMAIKLYICLGGIINLVLFAKMFMADTEEAVKAEVVRIALQFCHPDPQGRQFLAKLSTELVDKGLVLCFQVIFGHGLGYHLAHFITGNGPVTTEGAVPIALNNPICGQLVHCVVGPMVLGHITERVLSSLAAGTD